ncbi:unnamed protein product [Microthlaspi erraticum]|nr:unnamed protein product [Microthlaspi erraticum]
MSRNEVMIKLVKPGLDGLIEHSRPEPRTPADRATNVPRSSRAQHPRHPAKCTAELTYRSGKHRPAVEPFQPHHHNPRTTAQREPGSTVLRPHCTHHVPRPIHPSDQEGFVPRPVQKLRPNHPSVRPRRPNAKTLGHDRPDRVDSLTTTR